MNLYKLSMDNYFIVEVSITTEQEQEINPASRELFECQGVEEFSLDEQTVDEILGERSYSGADIPVEVIQEVEHITKGSLNINKYYFSNEVQSLSFQAWLKDNYNLEAKWLKQEAVDWNEEWRKSFQRIDVGDEFAIVPSWEKPDVPVANELYIYPGMGFGTGNHETTYLCLKLLKSIQTDLSGEMKCLDFGCGSGILGLALGLYFDSEIDLYDIDEDAIINCKQNIEINQLKSNKINLYLPADKEIITQKKYNLVFANILQNVLLLEKQVILNSLEKGSYLILSGLLNGQEELIIEKYSSDLPGLELIKVESKGDWCAVLMKLV